MGLSPKEQFRLGFLLRCAEEGIPLHEVQERIKLAFNWGPIANLAKALGSGLLTLPMWVGAGGLGVSAGIGAGTGYLAAKATDEDVDPDVVKNQELIAAYKQQAERARRNAARVSYRASRPKVRPPRLYA